MMVSSPKEEEEEEISQLVQQAHVFRLSNVCPFQNISRLTDKDMTQNLFSRP